MGRCERGICVCLCDITFDFHTQPSFILPVHLQSKRSSETIETVEASIQLARNCSQLSSVNSSAYIKVIKISFIDTQYFFYQQTVFFYQKTLYLLLIDSISFTTRHKTYIIPSHHRISDI